MRLVRRRGFLKTAAAVGAASMFDPVVAYAERSRFMTDIAEAPPGATSVRPFPKMNVPEAQLIDLRSRIKATRWPTREIVADDSQGVQLHTMQALARYWGSSYDWRKAETK